MNVRARLLPAVTALVFALVATESCAQFGGMGGMGGRSRGGGRDQGYSQDYRNYRPAPQDSDSYEQTEFRLQLLEEDLHLQSAQQPAWEAFAGRVRAYAGDLARARARAMTPLSGGEAGANGVQHIEQAAESARNRATALDDIAGAAKTLYAGLKPEQKMLADVRIATIIAPPPRAVPGSAGGADLPDLGGGGRTRR
jgi:hypothetical protein